MESGQRAWVLAAAALLCLCTAPACAAGDSAPRPAGPAHGKRAKLETVDKRNGRPPGAGALRFRCHAPPRLPAACRAPCRRPTVLTVLPLPLRPTRQARASPVPSCTAPRSNRTTVGRSWVRTPAHAPSQRLPWPWPWPMRPAMWTGGPHCTRTTLPARRLRLLGCSAHARRHCTSGAKSIIPSPVSCPHLSLLPPLRSLLPRTVPHAPPWKDADTSLSGANCPANCANCTSDAVPVCTLCANSTYLSAGQCVVLCPVGSYGSGFSQTGRECLSLARSGRRGASSRSRSGLLRYDQY